MLEKFIQSNEKSNPHSTITPDIIDVPNYNFNQEKYALKIWDMPGLSSYRLSYQYLDKMDGCLLGLDCTFERSFNVIQTFIDEIQKEYPNYVKNTSFLLIGCKSDLNNKRVISSKDVYKYSIQKNIIYLEDLFIQEDVENIINLLLTLIDNRKRL